MKTVIGLLIVMMIAALVFAALPVGEHQRPPVHRTQVAHRAPVVHPTIYPPNPIPDTRIIVICQAMGCQAPKTTGPNPQPLP